MYKKKTIASLVTAPINKNIVPIRISGPITYQIITKIFPRPLPEYLEPKPQLVFGKIVNPKKNIYN